MAGEDPSVQQPQTPAPDDLQGEEPTARSHSAARPEDNSDETLTPPQERGHIRRWFSRVRIAPAAKSTTIIVSALIGFIFGIASNQISGFVNRADDCYDALTQYETNVSQFPILTTAVHDQGLTLDLRDAANSQYNTLIAVPSSKIMNKCAIAGINATDLKHWEASDDDLADCLARPACSRSDASNDAVAAAISAMQLSSEATKISQWGLLRRAKYVVAHLY